MSKLIAKTEGLKTYAVASAMVVYVGLGYFLTGVFDTEMLLQAFSIAGLRHAIAKG